MSNRAVATSGQCILISLLLIGLLLAGIAPLLQAATNNARYPFNLPAAPFNQSINRFISITEWEIGYSAHLAQGVITTPVVGEFSAEEALNLMLHNTGLIWMRSNNGSILINSAPTTNALNLPALRVTGQIAPEDLPYQTPGSVNVITQKNIERFRGTSVGDIFQGTPGVLVGENRNSGGLDVNIRGMQGQSRVPVLIDGSRQETTVYRGYAGVSSRSYVDPDLIGSIRIDKGPVMTAEGTGATGGVVSMQTLNANDLIKEGKNWGIRLRGSLIGNNSGNPPAPGTPAGYHLGAIGDDGIYRIDCARPDICEQKHLTQNRSYALPEHFAPLDGMDRPGLLDFGSHAASLALARRFDWGDLVAAYAEREQGNYYAGKHGPSPYMDFSDQRRLPFYTEVRPRREGATRFRAEERIVNSNYASESLLLKGNFLLSDDQSLELSYLRYDSTYGELMPSQLMWFGTVRQTDNSTVRANTYSARYHWQPVEHDGVDLKLNIWHTNTRSRNVLYYLEGDFNNNNFTEEESDLAESYQRWGGDLINTMQFFVYGDPSLSYGLAFQKEDLAPLGSGDSMSMSSDDLRDGIREELSFFTALQWRPLSSLTLDSGIRYTRFSSEDRKAMQLRQDSHYCTTNSNNGKCDPVYYQSKESGLAPIISLTWEPLDGLQLYAHYAEALRMPSLFETTQGFSVNPDINIKLKPEHTKNREIGFNLLRTGLLSNQDKLGFKLAYFRNHTQDYLTRTSLNLWEESQITSAEFFRMRNIDSADFHGIELNLDYDNGRFFSNLSGTRYTQIEVCHHGSYRRYDCTNYGIANSYINNMIPPQWHTTALLGTRWFNKKLEIGLRGTFMGQRRLGKFHDDTRNGFNKVVPWHQYQLFDLFASYSPDDWITLDFNIDNLTDQYYLDALSLGLVPAPGRTAKVSMTLQF